MWRMGTKWLMIFVFLSVCSESKAQDGTLSVSVFSATSKSVTLRWTKQSGASSYMITVTPKDTPRTPTGFVQFGASTVMGSINCLSPNTLYNVQLNALNSNQATLANVTIVAMTAPEVMDPIQEVKAKDSTTLMVTFTALSSATHYVVRTENANGYFEEREVFSSPAEIPNLEPYTIYTLSIMSGNTEGRSQPSYSVEGKTVLPPPQLSTSSPSNDSIVVSWQPVNHAVAYTVQLSQLGVSMNTTGTNITVPNLDAGTLYLIQVYAWDPEGRKGESKFINQTTRPPSPTSLNVSAVWRNRVPELTVSWDANPVVHRPVLYAVTTDKGLSCNSTASQCTLSPATCSETYAISVTAWNEAGPSYPSGPVSFVSFPCPPAIIALTEPAAGNCTVIWNSVLYADTYRALIQRDDGSEDICNTTGTLCDFRCQCGYTYLMTAFALNQAGSSQPGVVLNYTTLPCCPSDVSISPVTTETLEITWTAARGAELYETRAADNQAVILCNDTAPVCALSGLMCDSPYSVLVTPCNEISGCNRACQLHNKDTAPCTPVNLVVTKTSDNSASVRWTASNRAANYTATASGLDGPRTCTSTGGGSCDLTGLPCGSAFEVSVTAASAAGQSLPSYSVTLETPPCCPANLVVDQVTQAMSNVTWSNAKGAETFIASLTSSRGQARCHTHDSHCLMGCITCGTNYTVTMQSFSGTGLQTNCTYQGFSSSACCPSGVKLYRMANNSIRVYWRSSVVIYNYTVALSGNTANHTCLPRPGETSCDVANVQCGAFQLVVAPLTPEGKIVPFCPVRMYSVTCLGDNIGVVLYRGKRSVD